MAVSFTPFTKLQLHQLSKDFFPLASGAPQEVGLGVVSRAIPLLQAAWPAKPGRLGTGGGEYVVRAGLSGIYSDTEFPRGRHGE